MGKGGEGVDSRVWMAGRGWGQKVPADRGGRAGYWGTDSERQEKKTQDKKGSRRRNQQEGEGRGEESGGGTITELKLGVVRFFRLSSTHI